MISNLVYSTFFYHSNAPPIKTVDNNDDTNNLFEKISVVQEEYYVDLDYYYETELVFKTLSENYESVLVGDNRSNRTNLKSDELESFMIKRYIITVEMGNRNRNDSDNKINLAEFSGT